MKNKLLIIGAVLVIAGCHNKSYYEVMNTNQQRFGGWQLDNARFLNESYDLILLVEDMSALAEKRSTLKETYLLASDASKSVKSLHFNYKTEALRLRVRLTSELSKTQDEYFHQLDKISPENFDTTYARCMKTKLEELELKMEHYTSSGKSERLIGLADEVGDTFRAHNESLK